MSLPIKRVTPTPEWLAENEAKQKAYQNRRTDYLKEIDVLVVG